MEKMPDRGMKDFHNDPNAKEDIFLDAELQKIACLIKEMPELDPPESLLTGVMKAIEYKKLAWHQRFIKWVRSPRSITFTPLQVGALASVMIFCATIALIQLSPKTPTQLALSGKDQIPVVFSLNLPDAQSVAVVGSFNQWRSQGFEMKQVGSNRNIWTITLNLPEGRYEYAFMVDGKKIIADPHASFYQNDGFGNENAVLILGNRDEKAI